jgi:Ca2+-binding EF-hand superfamily protein
MNKVDWDVIRKKLPVKRTAEHVERRKKMFNEFDPNGNGYLSLAELDKGIRDVLQLDNVFHCKPAIMRAYQSAKKSGGQRTKYSDDYIERNEFRIFLVYLRQYFEYWQMFDRIDTNDDRNVTLSEFKQAVPLLGKWGVKVTEPEKTFKEIDTNGGGVILFDEFSHWAIKKSLDLEDDDNFEDN